MTKKISNIKYYNTDKYGKLNKAGLDFIKRQEELEKKITSIALGLSAIQWIYKKLLKQPKLEKAKKYQ